MSKGILLFALDSDQYQYTAFADIAAFFASKNLNLPVSVITNNPNNLKFNYDHVIEQQVIKSQKREFSFGAVGDWHNLTRYTAYDLSPYDQTLLIDCDYFLYTDNLKRVFDTSAELCCFEKCYDLTQNNQERLNRLGFSDSPMFWATAIYFRKTQFSKLVFDFMENVRQNWQYYSCLYAFDSPMYRNDFSLTIALQVLTGQVNLPAANKLPGKLFNIGKNVTIKDIRPNGEFLIGWQDLSQEKIIRIRAADLHFMDKDFLTTNLVKIKNAA